MTYVALGEPRVSDGFEFQDLDVEIVEAEEEIKPELEEQAKQDSIRRAVRSFWLVGSSSHSGERNVGEVEWFHLP
jgi:hypothetical protein